MDTFGVRAQFASQQAAGKEQGGLTHNSPSEREAGADSTQSRLEAEGRRLGTQRGASGWKIIRQVTQLKKLISTQ